MKYLYLFLMCVITSACSVSQVNLHYVPISVDKPLSSKTCTPFLMPEMLPVPAAPIHEYAAIPDHEDTGRIHVLVNYIEKLRMHISETKRQLNTNYQKHLADCQSE